MQWRSSVVEQRIHKPQVAGSTPVATTRYSLSPMIIGGMFKLGFQFIKSHMLYDNLESLQEMPARTLLISMKR